jgi:membrane protease YdiL (CAAX protease family)
MSTTNINAPTAKPSPNRRTKLLWAAVLFAIVFPAFFTWTYFVFAGRYATSSQQVIYLLGKVIQFAFPIFFVAIVLREPLRTGRATVQGLFLGAVFSILVVAGGWLPFHFVLHDLPIFASASGLIREKIKGFGVDSFAKYALLAAFYSVFHSLLEEYYWRWFVFRQLRRLVPLWPSIVISALAFMAHHVVVLNVFFKDAPWLAWLFSSGVAMGGVFWAWLYERTGSLFGPWLSHALIDAGIFWIGFSLMRTQM